MGIWILICYPVKLIGVLNHPNNAFFDFKVVNYPYKGLHTELFPVNCGLSYSESVLLSSAMVVNSVLSLSMLASTTSLFRSLLNNVRVLFGLLSPSTRFVGLALVINSHL